jgi:short-subunit dehydrogenase
MHIAVTGASSGIGEALARAFFERGDAVTLIARRADRLAALAREGKSHVAAADLSDIEHAADWIDGAEAALGPIDVLVNNAGASMVHPTVATDWKQAEALIRLNLLAPFRLTCALAPRMVARGSGCIVDIASLAALAPQPGFFFYNASKAAVAAASESLREELRGGGVHVLTVYPGPVSTPMAEANFAAFAPRLARVTPTGDVRVLARLVIRAIERRRARLIYPRIYTIARWFPALARWTADRLPPPVRPRGHLDFRR